MLFNVARKFEGKRYV